MRNVTLAYSDDERWAYSDRATALRREPIETACAAAASGANDTTALLELDGYYNFCRIMGVVKLKEQPSTTFWRELYRRASLLPRPDGEAVVAARNAGIDSSTVCLQVRGRMKEETGQPLNQSQEVRTVLRLAEQMATRMDASSLFIATQYEEEVIAMLPKGLRALQRLRVERFPDHGRMSTRRRAATSTTRIKASALLPTTVPTTLHPANQSHQHNTARLRDSVAEFIALSHCPVLVLEESPIRCTFCLIAMLLGGMVPCEADQLNGAEVDYPWRALCKPTSTSPSMDAMLERRCLFDEVGWYPCHDASSGSHCTAEPPIWACVREHCGWHSRP